MKNLSYLLLSFTILITVVIAIIIKPSNLDIFSFFLALTWLVFIVFINWLVSFYFFSNTKQNSSKFGILPSLHLVVFLYSIFTVVTLFYFWNHYNSY
jgi:FtsH-binding integral membrane protein